MLYNWKMCLRGGFVNPTLAEGCLRVKKCKGVIEGEGIGVVSKSERKCGAS